MSGFWSIVLNILIFIVSLGALIVIHELGHLTTAKIFKVYCYEFSIGMAPAIYTHKPKKDKGQETAFSVRALPVGGFVSMAGEDLEEAEGVDPTIIVPKDRTIEGKSHWKRIIIMGAGVCMNFLLGYIMLIINFAGCPQYKGLYDTNQVFIQENSKAAEAGLSSNDHILTVNQDFFSIQPDGNYLATPDKSTGVMTIDRYAYTEQPESYELLNHTLNSLLSRDYKNGMVFYTSPDGSNPLTFKPINPGDKRVFTITYQKDGETEVKTANIEVLASVQKPSSSSFKSYLMYDAIGVGALSEEFHYTVGEGFKKAGDTFGYYCSAIFVGLGSLFTPAGWSEVGSIVSIFQISSTAVASGIGSFLNLWAMISINLGILNLLPFPGLDGWQIVITIGEWIALGVNKIRGKNKASAMVKKNMSAEEIAKAEQEDKAKEAKRKKTYDKIKSIMSTVGLVLLIGLSIALIIKDFISPMMG